MTIEKRPGFLIVFIPENAEERMICNNSDEFRVTNEEIMTARMLCLSTQSGHYEYAAKFRKDQLDFYRLLLEICAYLYDKGYANVLKWAGLPYPGRL